MKLVLTQNVSKLKGTVVVVLFVYYCMNSVFLIILSARSKKSC